MGGTFLRLVEQGHDVHVAYQTSGNIAVHDHDALRFAEFFGEFTQTQKLSTEDSDKKVKRIVKFLKNKGLGDADNRNKKARLGDSESPHLPVSTSPSLPAAPLKAREYVLRTRPAKHIPDPDNEPF